MTWQTKRPTLRTSAQQQKLNPHLILPHQQTADKPLVFSEKQAVEMLGVSFKTLYLARRAGELGYCQIGSRVCYRPEDLAEFIERKRVRRPVSGPENAPPLGESSGNANETDVGGSPAMTHATTDSPGAAGLTVSENAVGGLRRGVTDDPNPKHT